MLTENFQMLKLDLEKAEKPEIKLATLLAIKTAREFQKNIYFCFMDYAKAFDCVDHKNLWKILKCMGIRYNYTCLWRNLYASQEAINYNKFMQVRTGHGTTDWFQVGKGVCKGCILYLAYLTYMQNTSCEMPGRMKHTLKSRMLGEISITSEMWMIPPLWQKAERN